MEPSRICSRQRKNLITSPVSARVEHIVATGPFGADIPDKDSLIYGISIGVWASNRVKTDHSSRALESKMHSRETVVLGRNGDRRRPRADYRITPETSRCLLPAGIAVNSALTDGGAALGEGHVDGYYPSWLYQQYPRLCYCDGPIRAALFVKIENALSTRFRPLDAFFLREHHDCGTPATRSSKAAITPNTLSGRE